MDRAPLVATVLLTHESPEAVRRMCAYWKNGDPDHAIVVAYGGTPENYSKLGVDHAVFVDDPWLRTKDHPRERQSYLGVFQAVLPVIRELGASHVHVAEYDEIPLHPGLNARLLDLLVRENADVAGHRLNRVDGTGHPHYTFHAHDPAFLSYWQDISCREYSAVVLSMLGCGSFWTRAAFEAVAALNPPLRIYLELMLPTAAHHLGFRVRPMDGRDRFMAPEILKTPADFESYRQEGAWRIHPVKGYWSETVQDA
ncbi:hypothetical protein KBB96_15180 [Luteolibacter ambystomatis]|uniref:Uncharacterized protein n=1 Tax=Luteolibacter ambystomatis TaxID=2824561 RepID=A0A975IYB1_9BACT|nr:hypothetical protein [Luteolibacter ambystomatis]QUE50206.1 hypothetical protein KBB96_15180 [Luteolibacter ambystomatis]